MVYERRLKSRKEFFNELRGLEIDAGVRIQSTFRKRTGAIFITKHTGKYHLWIKQDTLQRGDAGTFMEFPDFEALSKFLLGVLHGPLHAFIY